MRMPRPLNLHLGLLTTALGLLAGCSSPQLYAAGQEWQRQQCRQLADSAERQRCLERAATDYDRYRWQSPAALPPTSSR
ncbi:hypothetical protein [Eleftheria terrae]|uniref:hypothetical protein n=1 Tax=Eleftheria terrae TaxID=1597781 RepID=UPI00263AFFCA|nr:hypothetical protein [Eleftheria terrae]WKB52515.1 hypothetical protein N7L95_22390 [Eleftheria terrae]